MLGMKNKKKSQQVQSLCLQTPTTSNGEDLTALTEGEAGNLHLQIPLQVLIFVLNQTNSFLKVIGSQIQLRIARKTGMLIYTESSLARCRWGLVKLPRPNRSSSYLIISYNWDFARGNQSVRVTGIMCYMCRHGSRAFFTVRVRAFELNKDRQTEVNA